MHNFKRLLILSGKELTVSIDIDLSINGFNCRMLWLSCVYYFKFQSDVDLNILFGEQDKELGEGHLKESIGEESDALLGRLIHRLTVIFVQHVPSFWRLALLIFSGKFVKVCMLQAF